jgi:myo-inositol 2-dehydrogenase / D-chiro-inositol 1-dehydrogenase
MLKIAALGAGSHSRLNHLPALAHYRCEHPNEIELAALCDLDAERARSSAAEFGFRRTYTDMDRLLDEEQPDGLVAVTPVAATAAVAARVIARGVPLLMEKPPGATLAEARDLERQARALGARVMVSVNRRFEPPLRAALDWIAGRAIRYVRCTMVRPNRTEEDFITGTAIHTVDALRHIAGDVADCSTRSWRVNGCRWYLVSFRFVGGTEGVLEVIPTAGFGAERYDLFGHDFWATAHSGSYDNGRCTLRQGGQVVRETTDPPDTPYFLRAGAYGETVEFIDALKSRRPPRPSPTEVLQSVELCYQIAADAEAV